MGENYQKKELLALMSAGANKRERRAAVCRHQLTTLYSLCRL